MVAKLTSYAEFELHGNAPAFIPGQYFFVTLAPNDEAHKEELTHHFSIVNSPSQKGILALTTRLRLEESLFKRTLNDAKVGDEVEIGKIAGSFVLPETTDKPIVFIALGIGITPFISMLRWAFEENKDYKFSLVYSDNEIESMAFLDELKQMEKDRSGFELFLSVTQDEAWQGEKRRVDGQMLKDYLQDIENKLYFISGPPKIVEAVTQSIKDTGVSEDNLKTDSFSGY